MSEMLTLREAQRVSRPIVYGLCDADGSVFYVGQTRNARRRFEGHRLCATKNAGLREKLTELGETARVVILVDSPADLHAAERAEISARKGNLVNLIGEGHWSWAHNSEVPWAAGTGVHSPSAYAMLVAGPEAKTLVRKRLTDMSPPERCRFELGVLASYSERLQRRFAKWLSIAGPKMAAVIGTFEFNQEIFNEPERR